MTIERKPVAVGDMRGWMRALAAAGDMHTPRHKRVTSLAVLYDRPEKK